MTGIVVGIVVTLVVSSSFDQSPQTSIIVFVMAHSFRCTRCSLFRLVLGSSLTSLLVLLLLLVVPSSSLVRHSLVATTTMPPPTPTPTPTTMRDDTNERRQQRIRQQTTVLCRRRRSFVRPSVRPFVRMDGWLDVGWPQQRTSHNERTNERTFGCSMVVRRSATQRRRR